MPKKILLVDDEIKMTEALKAYLDKNGYETFTAHNGKDALELFKTQEVSLVVLDLMLPDIKGEDICRIIRSQARTPIIMLTAKSEEANLLEGFSLGADDYLIKPIGPRVIVAKIDAVLRRVECDSLMSSPISFNEGHLIVDFQSGIVKRQGEIINLTPTEYKLLRTMVNAPNRIFSRDQLIAYALGDDFDGFNRSIDTYIKSLRSKIEPDRRSPQYIITAHGLGYKFQPAL
jgi:DNA-binding response OmpR family regulator